MQNPLQYKSGLPIWFDASCSGSQIISLLFGIDTYANSLNITVKKESDILGDFYSLIISDFKTFLSEICQNNAEQQFLFDSIEKNSLTNKIIWRKFLKKIIMTMNYGLTKRGVLSKLYEANRLLNLAMTKNQIKFIHLNLWDFLLKEPLFKRMQLISNLVFKLAESHKKSLIIYSNSHGFTSNINKATRRFKQKYNINLKKIIKTDRKAFKNVVFSKRVSHQLTLKKNVKGTIDSRKQAVAIKANLIHHLDGMWIHNVILNIIKNKIKTNILVIHDCFGLPMSNIDYLRSLILESLEHLFKNEKNIEELVLQLIPSNKSISQSLLKKWRSRKIFNLNKCLYLIFP